MDRLSTFCLDHIFRYFNIKTVNDHVSTSDRLALTTCLLVNRQWFEIAVKIFWEESVYNLPPLLACLPDESKQIIRDNVPFIPETDLNTPPFMNYMSINQQLNFNYLNHVIRTIIIRYDPDNTVNDDQQRFQDYKEVIYREMVKLFMLKAPLRKLHFFTEIDDDDAPHVDFASFPNAINTLKQLTTFETCTDVDPRFLQQVLSCQKFENISLHFEETYSEGLTEIVNNQNNLKGLKVIREHKAYHWPKLADSLENHPSHHITLTKLYLSLCGFKSSIRFLRNFENLRELTLYQFHDFFDDFEVLQHVSFPHLRYLKMVPIIPREEELITFFERNGKSLEHLEIDSNHEELDFCIPRFCPNLKHYGKIRNTRELMENLFDHCKELRVLWVTCKNNHFNESKIIRLIGRDNFGRIEQCAKELGRIRPT
ncbi:12720_t:CDS:2 [Funneliformis mosseae]|uniref:12720_t:CDS:1 n=1 Tax=Funneliformis mosseae TaxID=27381 RepID=A0A9N8ZW82_FUNMO|nr:12720_t:CDS:2 [Funneliformis mosseae]